MNRLLAAALVLTLTSGCLRYEEEVQTPVTTVQPAAPPETQVVEPDPIVEDATEQNVGVKGRDYGGEIVTEQISQYFRIQDRLVMQQIQDGLNKFNGKEGRMPSSHEEFVEEILKPRNLKLPEVKQGSRIYYDPEREKVVIARPAGPGQAQQ